MHGKHHMPHMHHHQMHNMRHHWGHRHHGMFPILPMVFFFVFVFFILPKIAFLLPFLLIGGAIWWMSSGASRGRWGGWSRDQWQQWSREWGCEGDDGEKPKRVEIIEEKPKRGDGVEYV